MPINEKQTAHSQHPVPQNIMSVEFKLVGDLTVRQFVYLMLGGITVYLSFISNLPFLWKWGLISFAGFGSLALSFVPFGDRGLDQWIKNFIKSISMPTQRVWRKETPFQEYFLSDYADVVKKEVVALAPTRSRKALSSYLEENRSQGGSSYSPKEEAFLKRINFDVDIPQRLKSYVSKTPAVRVQVSSEKKISPASPRIQEQFGTGNIVVRKRGDLDKIPAITNIAVGRTLKHIPLEGEIVLPKRTRRIPPTPKKRQVPMDDRHRKELLKQAVELKKVLKRAEEKFTPEGAVLPAHEFVLEGKNSYKAKEKELNTVINMLKGENKRLSDELKTVKEQLSKLDRAKKSYSKEAAEFEHKIEDLEQKKNLVLDTIQTKVSDASEEGGDYNAKVVEKISESVVKGSGDRVEATRKVESVKPTPNVVWGTVRDKEGRLLEDATLIIRDENDEPVRALKTNRLGQFMSSTALPNGAYKIEVLNNDNSFDIMDISLVGKVIKPINFSAIKN